LSTFPEVFPCYIDVWFLTNPNNPRWIWVKFFPWVALGKARALEGEFSRIGFPGCNSWRVLGESIIIGGVLGATKL
jgi:hypothetical protein